MKYVKQLPVQMEEYTISEVVQRGGRNGYVLEEIDGGILPNGSVVIFDESRFVKLDEIDTLEITTEDECLINLQ